MTGKHRRPLLCRLGLHRWRDFWGARRCARCTAGWNGDTTWSEGTNAVE